MNRATGNVVDSKVVELSFNNENFEKNAKQSLDTLSKLKASLKFDGASKGFDEIDRAAKRVSFDSIAQGIDAIEKRFSTFGIVGATIIMDLTRKAEQLVAGVINKVTALPRMAWQKITEGGKMRAMSIENARFMLQGLFPDDLEEVERIMDDASDSVTGTAYAFDSAAQAASQFAASGLKAGNDMQKALKGITGVAAMTNSQYEDISRIFTTVAGNGRLMGDQLLQLSGRGLNAASTLAQFFNDVKNGSEKVKDVTDDVKKKVLELGKGMDITEAEIRDFVSKGKISFDIFSESMSSAFGEHAKDANKTLTGSLDNMQAALKRIGQKFYEPLIKQEGPLVNLFNAVRVKINEVNAALDPLINALSGGVIKGIEKLTKLVEGFDFQGSGFKSFLDGFARVNRATISDWEKLEKAGLVTTSYIKNLRKIATDAGVKVAKSFSDEEWLNHVLKYELLTTKQLSEALNTLGKSAVEVNSDIKDTFDKFSENDEMKGYLAQLEELGTKYSKEDLMSIIFGNGELEDAKEIESVLDGMLKLMDLDQTKGDSLRDYVLSLGYFGEETETTTKALTELSAVELKRLGYTRQQISEIQKLKKEGKDSSEILESLGIDTMSGTEHFASAIGNIFEGLIGFGKNIAKTFDAVFPDTNAGFIHNVLVGFDAVTKSISDFINNSDVAGKIFTGIASAFDLVLRTGKAVGQTVFNTIGNVLKGLNIDILGIVGNVGDTVSKFRDWIVENKILESIVNGVSGAISGGIKIVKDWVGSFIDLDKVKERFKGLKEGFKEGFGNIGDFIVNARDKISEFIENFKLTKGLKFENIGEFFTGIKDRVIESISEFKGFGKIKEVLSGIWDSITAKFKTFGIDLGFVSTAFNFLGNTATKVFNKIKSVGGKAFTVATAFGSTFITRFQSLFTKMQGKVQPFLEGGKAKIQEFIDKVKGIGKINLSTIGDVFKALKDTVIDYFANFEGFDAIKEAFANFWDDVKAKSKEMGVDVDWLIDGFENFGSFAGKAFDTVLSGAKGALSWLKKVWDSFRQSEIIQNAVERFSSAFTYLWNNSGTFFSGIIEKIGEFGKKVKELGGVKLSNLGDIFGAFRDSVGEYILNFDGFKMLGDAFRGLFGDINLSLKDSFGIDVEAIMTGIKDLIDKIWETISNLKWPTSIGELPEFFDSIAKSIQEFEVPESFKSLFKTVDDAVEIAEDGSKLDTAEEKTVTMFDTIKSIFKVLGNIAKWIKEHFVVFVVLAMGFKLVKGIAEVIRDVKDVIEAQSKKLEANAFKTKMLGILELAGAIWVLVDALNRIQNMDPDKVKGAVGTLATIFALLGALVLIVGLKFEGELGGYQVKAGPLFALAGIVAAIGLTLSALMVLDDKNDPEKLGRIVNQIRNVFGYLAALVIAVGIVVGLTTSEDGSNMTVAALDNIVSLVRTIGLVLGGLALLDTLGLVDIDKIKTLADSVSEIVIVLGGLTVALGAIGKFFGEDAINAGAEGFMTVTKDIGTILAVIFGATGLLGLFDQWSGGMITDSITAGMDILVPFIEKMEKPLGLLIAACGAISFIGLFGGAIDAGAHALEVIAPKIGIILGAIGVIAAGLGIIQTGVQSGLGLMGMSVSDTWLADAVETGLNMLVTLCEKIGEGLGKLLGALVTGAFVENIKGIEESISSIKTILEESKGMGEVKLSDFDPISKSVIAIGALSTVIDIAELIKSLGTFAVKVLVGKSAVEKFGEDVQILADSISNFKTILDGAAELAGEDGELSLDDFDPISTAVLALVSIATVIDFTELLDAIPNAIVELTRGKSAVKAFADDVKDMADAITYWNNNAPKDDLVVDIESIDKLGGAIEKINGKNLSTSIDTAIANWITDEDKTAVQKFGDDISDLANALIMWNFKSLFFRNLHVDSEAIDAITEAIDHITKTGGLKDVVGKLVVGELNTTEFETRVGSLGSALAKFNTNLGGDIDASKIWIAAKALDSIATIASNMAMMADSYTNLDMFSTSLEDFAKYLNQFVTDIGDNLESLVSLGDASADITSALLKFKDIKLEGDLMSDELVSTFKTNLETIRIAIEGLKDIDTSGVDRVKAAASDLSEINLSSYENTDDSAAKDAGEKSGKAAMDSSVSAISSSGGEVSGAISGVMSDAVANADVSGFFKIGFDIVKQIADGIRGNDSANSAIGSVALNAASTINDYFSSFHSSGAYVTSGFTSGIYSQMLEVLAAAQAIAQAAVNRIKTVIKSASPSKVTMQLGGYFGEGFEIGILKKVGDVSDASTFMGESARNGLNDAIRGINAMLTSNIDAQPVIRPVLDLSDVQSGVATIDSIFTTAPSIGLSGNISAIDEVVAQRNQSASLDDVVTALGLVERSTSSIRGGDTYNVNGITYDDGTNISDAIRILAHEVLMDRRR